MVVVTVAVLVIGFGWWVWPIPSDENRTRQDVLQKNGPLPNAAISSKIAVDKTTLTFDPQTCTEGRASFYWGLGSCAVTVLHHEGNQCVFEYTEEIEMGASVYLVKVPVTSGPVTVKIDRVTQGERTYPWPVTSFPLDKAKVLRQGGGRGIWTYRVDDTEAFVTVFPSETRSELVPKQGDAVRFQFELFNDHEFKDSFPGAVFRPTVEFVVGSDSVWPWLRIATEGMAVGDRRQVELPTEVADGAKEWLPKASEVTELYVEVSLVSARSGK